MFRHFGIVVVSVLIVPIFFLSPVSNFRDNLYSLGVMASRVSGKVNQQVVPPRHPRVVAWQALTLIDDNQSSEAVKLLSALPQKHDSLVVGLLARALTATDNAQPDYDTAINLWTAIGAYSHLVDLAKELQIKGRIAESRVAFFAAYRVFPERVILQLVDFLAKTEGNNSAIVQIQTHIRDVPFSPHRQGWLLTLSKLLREEGRWDEAEQIGKTMIAESPASVDGYIQLGYLAYQRDKDLDEARSYFQEVIRLHPESGEGYYYTGEVLALMGHLVEADDWYRQALKFDPKQREWSLRRAWVARRAAEQGQSDFSHALSLYVSIIEQWPNDPEVYYEIAWAYLLSEQPDSAVKAIQQAISLSARPNEWYFYRAGQIYEWVNENVTALDFYRQSLHINPANISAQQGIERLEITK